ncbi:hypothetical protein LSTR_LSTR000327 [Laodelphax striatellus]|uniref:Sphingomyelin phosphodiesterase C-terminal domain-containing protein n=2 Tax=Laodelphax striatellus TaxID=195883 RepID=A0A482X7B8_LAOST|nr:hypothetical protein LSTR_LSTR000327 [Laodelphax striatellus]
MRNWVRGGATLIGVWIADDFSLALGRWGVASAARVVHGHVIFAALCLLSNRDMALMAEFLLMSSVLASAHGRLGYFWHITDLHWDIHYGTESHNCWHGGGGGGRDGGQQQFGDHNCDSPWSLIQSAVRMMRDKHGDNIEFVLWTGISYYFNSLSRKSGRLPSHSLNALKNLTTLLRNTFSSQFVFPVMGHDDPIYPYRHLTTLWKQWLPNEALYTLSKGGYYTIEQKVRKLRLVLLNTNLWAASQNNDEDPENQWLWLEDVLQKSQRNKETVYLVGHVAPGADERQAMPTRKSILPRHNAKYLDLVRRYANIITGQFFGHLHSDSFRVIYSDDGKPVSWIFLAPSVTPRRTQSGSNNPALRLYKFDTDTGQVQDYVQYYLDLSTANRDHRAEWQIEYNLTSYYGFRQVSARDLHELAESFTVPDGHLLFSRYYLANSVQTSGLGLHDVNAAWAHSHYCAISRVDYTQYQSCLATGARALAASTSLGSRTTHSNKLLLIILGYLASVTR